jgi:hypothetical protein
MQGRDLSTLAFQAFPMSAGPTATQSKSGHRVPRQPKGGATVQTLTNVNAGFGVLQIFGTRVGGPPDARGAMVPGGRQSTRGTLAAALPLRNEGPEAPSPWALFR